MNRLYAYTTRVERIIAFCEALTVPDGALAGQRVKLRPWQKDFIAAVYGPVNAAGLRIVREALLTIGRKNGKTALIAMLSLVHLCGPEAVRNGQIYSVAFDREQASIVFKYAASMVYASEVLSRRLNVVETMKKIADPGSGSVYQALSSESRSKHGRSSSVIIFDELAQFGRDRRLYDVMRTSRAAHREPLMFYISTQAADDSALFSELVDRGKKINSGEIKDPSFMAFVYEVPKELDAFDEKNWHLANPALGDFLNIEILREDATKAQESSSSEAAFRNLYLNQRVSAEESFISPGLWERNSLAPDESLLDNRAPCWAGLDLSAKNDLTALVFVCADEEQQWHVLSHFFVPQGGIKFRSDHDRVPYDVWARDGYVTATPGNVVDYDYVAATIGEFHIRYNIQALRVDPWKFNFLSQAMMRAGISFWVEGEDQPISGALRIVKHIQGFKSFTSAVERLEDLLLEGRIRHGNNPVLTLCAANTRVIKDPAGNRKFDKSRESQRIDGIVALAMALNWTEDTPDDGKYLDALFSSEPVVLNW